MQSPRPEGATALTALVLAAVLVVGLWSLPLVPFYRPLWGLDFQNVYAFQTCREVEEHGVYSVDGETCGDENARPFIYPPALFHGFFWVDHLPFDAAVVVWNAFMVGAMLAVGAAWLWMDGRLRPGWRLAVLASLWLLLLAQFPFVFALERGNNDVVPLVLWTAAAWLFVRRRVAVAGGAAGTAIAAKVYPVVAFLVVFVGALRSGRRTAALLAAGCMAGALLASVLWWDETVRYLTEVLPEFADRSPSLGIINHPIQALPGPNPLVFSVAAVLLVSWVVASWRGLATRPLLVFAGALAISTYFSSTSWDYNLITAYPLLLLLSAKAIDPRGSATWKLAAVAAIFTIASGRGFLDASGQLWAQVAALAAIGWLVAFGRSEDATAAPVPAAVDTPLAE